MKLTPGQQVILLDTTHKPAGSAIIQQYHAESHQYTVLFQYPGTTIPENIIVPGDRLLLLSSITLNT